MGCANSECLDLPDEPGPCDAYVPCVCGWPAAGGEEHCKTCQHQSDCHKPASLKATSVDGIAWSDVRNVLLLVLLSGCGVNQAMTIHVSNEITAEDFAIFQQAAADLNKASGCEILRLERADSVALADRRHGLGYGDFEGFVLGQTLLWEDVYIDHDAERSRYRWIFLHEVGHLFGLGHVTSPLPEQLPDPHRAEWGPLHQIMCDGYCACDADAAAIADLVAALGAQCPASTPAPM